MQQVFEVSIIFLNLLVRDPELSKFNTFAQVHTVGKWPVQNCQRDICGSKIKLFPAAKLISWLFPERGAKKPNYIKPSGGEVATNNFIIL